MLQAWPKPMDKSEAITIKIKKCVCLNIFSLFVFLLIIDSNR